MKRRRNNTKAEHSATSFNGKLLPKWAKISTPFIKSGPCIIDSSFATDRSYRSTFLPDPNDIREKQREDDYLRTLTYHAIANFLESHLQNVLQSSCSETLREIIDVNVFAEDVNVEQKPTSQGKTDKAEIDDASTDKKDVLKSQSDTPSISESLLRKCTIQKYSFYDPLLLPVFSLDHLPFAMPDKLSISSHLFHQIRKANPRTCCVTVPSSFHHHPSSIGFDKNCISFQEDFMNECWKQELNKLFSHSNDLSRKKLILRQLKKIKCTLPVTDQIVIWASRTIYFDRIFVFWNIEHGSVMYNHHSGMINQTKSFEHFVQWCAERRSLNGIPISLVCYNPKNGYRQSIPFYSSIQSMVGLRVRNISVTPDPAMILHQFWENILADIVQRRHPTATFLYSICQSYEKDVSRIFDTFQHQDQSIIRFIRSIKVLIARYLSAPSNSKSFPATVAVLCHCFPRSSKLLKRITSLFFDEGFLKYLVYNGQSSSKTDLHKCNSILRFETEFFEVRCVLVSIVLKTYWTIWDKYIRISDHNTATHSKSMKSCSSLPFFLLFDSQPSCLRDENILLKDDDRRFLVNSLLQYRTKSYASAFINHGPISSRIDLLGGSMYHSEVNLIEQIRRLVDELIILFDHCLSLRDILLCLESVLKGTMQLDPKFSYPSPLPRDDYVRALLDDIKTRNSTKSNSFIRIPGCLYEIIRNRVTITEAEWYQAFLQLSPDVFDCASSTEKLFLLFACGIRHLQVSGLIRRYVGKNSTVQYERTALVWCGGD